MRSTATSPGPVISDQTLLGRLQAGDEGALGALYERYAPLLYSLAVRVVGDRQLAQEVIQNTVLRCWDRAERYDSARGPVTEEPAPGSPAPTGPHLLDRRI